MPDVRVSEGVPTALDFTSPDGTPLVVDLNTGNLYAYIDGAVTLVTKGGLVLLDEQIASTSATLDFVTGFTSYQSYIFDCIDLVPDTVSNTLFQARISQDAGANFKAGVSDYEWIVKAFATDNAEHSNFDSADTRIALTHSDAGGGIGNTSGASLSGLVRLSNPASTARRKHLVTVGMAYVDAGGNTTVVNGSGGAYVADTAAINGLRFMFSTGNIASGTIRQYGVINL